MNSRQERRKLIERAYLERFLILAGWAVSDIGDGESPDFTFHVGAELVGIEVTELLKGSVDATGSAAKRDEQQRARIIRQLARDYYAAGGAPAIVRAIWPGNRRSTPEGMVPELIRERKNLSDWADGRIDRDGGEIYYITALPRAVGSYDRWECVSDSVGWVAGIDFAALRGAIKAKSAKIAEYRKKAQRIALLIVADQRRNSAKWRPPASFIGLPGLGFDEVHLLMYPDATQRIDLGAAV